MIAMKKKKRKTSFIIPAILAVLVGFAAIYCSSIMLESQEMQGIVRQQTEERLAKMYISDVEKAAEKGTRTETVTEYEDSDLEYTDENYMTIDGTVYTPEYAKGHIDCVLEIPSINLRRGVYTGSMAEVRYDFDIWMTTVGHPEYQLGKTHYAINGHNSLTRDLSFNRLKDVKVGEYFLLTNDKYVFLYDVTDIFADWRPETNRDIINNWTLPSDKCYVLTCGRDENRYKDVVVEGTLRERYSLSEWEDVKDEITATKVVSEVTVEYDLEKMNLSARCAGGEVIFSLTYPDGTPCPDMDICVGDHDGLFLKDKNGYDLILKTDENGKCSLPYTAFSREDTYVAGVLDFDIDGYQSPNDVEISVQSEVVSEGEIEIGTVAEEQHLPDTYMYIWAGFIGLLLILFVLFIVETVRGLISYRRAH